MVDDLVLFGAANNLNSYVVNNLRKSTEPEFPCQYEH